jgi:hypothetical protein
VKPSDPGLFPFFINLRDSPHSLNDKFPSKEFFCSSLNLTSCWKKKNYPHIYDWMNTISCNIVPVQIEFLIVLKLEKKVLYQQNHF